MMNASTLGSGWTRVCALQDIPHSMGVCALLGQQQVAVFRMPDEGLYALANHDPHSGANVLSRGLIGDVGGEPVVASPMYKHHFSLKTGVCLEDAQVVVATYAVQACEGQVWVCLP